MSCFELHEVFCAWRAVFAGHSSGWIWAFGTSHFPRGFTQPSKGMEHSAMEGESVQVDARTVATKAAGPSPDIWVIPRNTM